MRVSHVKSLASLQKKQKKTYKKAEKNKNKKKISDLVAFRAARRALGAKRVPRSRSKDGAALGEGGYGKVYAVSDDVVVKVVAVDGDYTEDDMSTADITKNPFREVAIYQRSNRLVAKGLTDHVAMMLSARRVRGAKRELHLYLERFDSSMYDWIRSGKATDGALRSVVAQALHGYYVMERELGFHQSDFNDSNVLVKATASAPRTWRWTVDGLHGLHGLSCSVPSFGVFACLSDFGACDIDAFPPIPLSAVHARRYAHDRAMTPVKFLDIVVELSLRSGIRGPFIETLEGILYDRVLYERQEAPPRSSELASFNAVEGRRILPDGRSAVSAPPTAAELLRLCCDVHHVTKGPRRAERAALN